jgi:hypothetical protein
LFAATDVCLSVIFFPFDRFARHFSSPNPVFFLAREVFRRDFVFPRPFAPEKGHSFSLCGKFMGA